MKNVKKVVKAETRDISSFNQKPLDILYLTFNTGEEMIVHVNHDVPPFEEWEEWEDYGDNIYLVFEYFSNFPRVHIIMDTSADLAIQEVYEYLLEEENQDDPLLTGYYMIKKENN